MSKPGSSSCVFGNPPQSPLQTESTATDDSLEFESLQQTQISVPNNYDGLTTFFSDTYGQNDSPSSSSFSPYNDALQSRNTLEDQCRWEIDSAEPSFFSEYATSLLDAEISSAITPPSSRTSYRPDARCADVGEGVKISRTAPMTSLFPPSPLSLCCYPEASQKYSTTPPSATSAAVRSRMQTCEGYRGSEDETKSTTPCSATFDKLLPMVPTCYTINDRISVTSPADGLEEYGHGPVANGGGDCHPPRPLLQDNAKIGYPDDSQTTDASQYDWISAWNSQTAVAMATNESVTGAAHMQSSSSDPHFLDNELLFQLNTPGQSLENASTASYLKPDRNQKSDELLIRYREMGLPYNQIRELIGSKVQLSTLRGRYRSLTKPKCQRVRKPVWAPKDVGVFPSKILQCRHLY